MQSMRLSDDYNVPDLKSTGFMRLLKEKLKLIRVFKRDSFESTTLNLSRTGC